jgi:RHS repeat-associated protein
MYSSTAYAPFGEPYAQAGTADLSFTGQNQDTVGGLYDFFFREYSTQGRWPSPDPAGLAAVDLSDPQSLDRYAYVRNDPVDLVDPLGLQDEGVGLGCTIGGQGFSGFFCEFFFNRFFRGPRGDFSPPDKPDKDKEAKPRLPARQQPPPQPSRTTGVNRCAADLANTASVAALTGTQNVPIIGTVLSNTVSSLSQLAFGPSRLGGVQAGATTASAGTVLQKSAALAGRIEVNPGFQSVFTTVAPTTLSQTAVGSVGVNLLQGTGAFLSAVFRPQLLYDAGVYVGALIVCAQQ